MRMRSALGPAAPPPPPLLEVPWVPGWGWPALAWASWDSSEGRPRPGSRRLGG